MIDKKILKIAILQKFNTLSECAQALSVDKSTFTRLMEARSKSFLERLRKVGVIVPLTEEELIAKGSGFSGAMPAYSYPILSEVFAGEPDSFVEHEYDEYYSFPYKKNSNRCFVLRVNGESMESTLSNGDLVLCDMDEPLTDNCLVAIKLANGHQYIKRYREINYAFVQLTSDNPNFDTRLIDKNDIVAIYRVVQSVRQH